MAQPDEVGLQTSFKPKVPTGISAKFIALESRSAKRSPIGGHPCQGQYFTSETNPNPEVAIFVVHYSADFSEHYLGPHLAAQGYGLLGFNTRFRGAEDRFMLEHALDDIAAGVSWLRDVAKAKKIVFIGNSGGGSLLAAYQAKAQIEPSFVSADAFIFLNAHPGRPDVLTKYLDPSVVDETDPTKTDSSLDMYDPANKAPYSQEFITRYRAAQTERNHRITKWAKTELKRLNDAGIPDRIFPLYRTMADLRFVDSNIDPSDREAPACFVGDPEKANRGIGLLGRTNTLRTWLSMWSLEESKCKLELHASKFNLPTLVIQGTADTGVYPSDAQHVYDIVATKDKELGLIPGGHFFDESQEALDGVIKVIGDWLAKKL
jgi:pimeloyl-ACP methyl ester carboxylesterase